MKRIVWDAFVTSGSERGFKPYKTDCALRRKYDTGWGEIGLGLASSGGVVRTSVRIGVRIEALERLVARYRPAPLGRNQTSRDTLFRAMLFGTPHEKIGHLPADDPSVVASFVSAHWAAFEDVAVPWIEHNVTPEGLLAWLNAELPEAYDVDTVYYGSRHAGLLLLLQRKDEAAQVWSHYRLLISEHLERTGQAAPALAADLAAIDRMVAEEGAS